MILKNKLPFIVTATILTSACGASGYLIHNNLKKTEQEIDIEKTLKDLQASVIELIPAISGNSDSLTLEKVRQKLPNIKQKIESIKNEKNSWKDYSESISPTIEQYLQIIARIEGKINKTSQK